MFGVFHVKNTFLRKKIISPPGSAPGPCIYIPIFVFKDICIYIPVFVFKDICIYTTDFYILACHAMVIFKFCLH